MSISYYNKHAQLFFDSTFEINMEALTARFLSMVPAKGSILDAGCGSGRDSKYFEGKNYKVTAFDASEELVHLAQPHLSTLVQVCTFEQFTSELKFDGIWACASLLHVPEADLSKTFSHLAQFLKEEGAFYCSRGGM